MREPVRAFAIVLAAGAGRRLDATTPKSLLRIGGAPIVALAVDAARASRVEGVIVTAPPGQVDEVLAIVGPGIVVIEGGETRQDSVRCALDAVPDGVGLVAIHDAARPFATPSLFDAAIAAAAEGAGSDGVAGAIPVVPVTDTVKRVADDLIVATEPRDGLVLAQTPQAFDLVALRDAHARAAAAARAFTDDAAVLEWAGYRVRTIAGEPDNFKITTPSDVSRAEAWERRSRG